MIKRFWSRIIGDAIEMTLPKKLAAMVFHVPRIKEGPIPFSDKLAKKIKHG